MFRGRGLAKPQSASVLGALVTAVVVHFSSQASPVLGYITSLMALILIVVAMNTGSIWPTQARKENVVIFSLFWGLMLGALLPFVIATYLEEGASGLYEIFTS